MSKTYVYIVSDDFETSDRVKAAAFSMGAQVQSFSPNEWSTGLESPFFRASVSNQVPSLSGGAQNPAAPSPVGSHSSNLLQFPQQQGPESKVTKMEDMESKAIENAILQFKGNLTEAARALGIGRATLYRKVKQYHIDPTVARRRRPNAA